MVRKYKVPKPASSSAPIKKEKKKRQEIYSDEESNYSDSDNDLKMDFSNGLDEEIDEDEAFNEEDELKWGEFFNARKERLEREEESDEEEDDDDEEGVDISEMLNQEDNDADEVEYEDFEQEDDSEEEEEDKNDQLKSLIKNLPKETTEEFQELEEESTNASTSQMISIQKLLSKDKLNANLQQQLKALSSAQEKKKIHAPLPVRLQDKLDRQVAYKATLKEVQKWTPLILSNKKKETLIFPLDNGRVPAPQNTSNATLVDRFRPETEMEKEIEMILEQSGFKTEKQIMEKENELMMNQDLDLEKIKEQRIEMQKLRSLLFYAEQKAKRAAKIKSKKYRKLKKKDKEKLEEMENLLYPKEDDINDERLEMERIRAEERMNLKHKSNSKWAKKMLKNKDDQSRQALLEHYNRHEKLTKKIEGRDSDASSDVSVSESEQEMEKLQQLYEEVEQFEPKTEAKGVMAMKFMQKAMEQQKQRSKEKIMEIQKELEEGSDDEEEMSESEPIVKSGRMKFTPSAIYEQESAPVKEVPKQNPIKEDNQKEEDIDTSDNPWLSTLDDVKKPRTEYLISEKSAKSDSGRAKKLANKMAKLEKKIDSQIEVSETTLLASEQQELKPVIKKEPVKKAEKEEPKKRKENDDFSQRDLIELAFANDSVLIEEFDAEKQKLVDEETAKPVDIALPGWGSWSGPGIKAKKRKILVEPAPSSQHVDPKKRQDRNLKHVIINEKMDKKFMSKYTTPNLPHPYENSKQYENVIRNPLGSQWNTQAVHQKLIRPSVITKKGTIIHPMKFHAQK